MSAEPDDAVRRLRERLEAADAEITAPAGLWERVSAPDSPVVVSGGTADGASVPGSAGLAAALGRIHRWRLRAAHPLTAVALAAAAVVAVLTGAWWLGQPGAPAHTGPAAGPANPSGPSVPSGPSSRSGRSVPLTVHNAERPCRDQRIMECALRVANDPYARYAAPDNRAALVWHGDRVIASCVVTDGTLVTDEEGISSSRWYRVRAPDGAHGWLPGVRTRNTQDVRTCSADETPRSPHTR